MTLCDTGPLIALLDEGDPCHETCGATLELLGSDELITTWPCLTETMHFAFRAHDKESLDIVPAGLAP